MLRTYSGGELHRKYILKNFKTQERNLLHYNLIRLSFLISNKKEHSQEEKKCVLTAEHPRLYDTVRMNLNLL